MSNLNIISSYRAQLMGFAILWVMSFHTNMDLGVSPINKFLSIGYGGVDIFLFLSGVGLYYSYKKKSTISQFYKRRLLRIFPTYILIIFLIDLFTKDFSLVSFLIKITTIGFWFPFAHLPYFTWYIPAIVLLYFIFPFYMKLFVKNTILSTLLLSLIGLFLSGSYAYYFFTYYPEEKNLLILFTARIPIFFIGIYFGMMSFYEKYEAKSNALKKYICIVLFVIGVVVLYYSIHRYNYWVLRNGGLFYYPFILITPGLCILLGDVFSLIPAFLNKIFIFIGNLSLEIYLLHEILFKYNHNFISFVHCSPNIGYLFLMCVSIFLAYIISKFVYFGTSLINKFIIQRLNDFY